MFFDLLKSTAGLVENVATVAVAPVAVVVDVAEKIAEPLAETVKDAVEDLQG